MKKLLIAVSTLLAMNAANAEQYVGVGVLNIDSDDLSITSIAATFDHKYNDNLGVQIGVATGGDDDIYVLGFEASVELDYALSAKVKAGFPTQAGFLYGTVGYSKVELDGKALGITVSENGNGAMAGVGADFNLSDQWGLGLEFNRGFGDIEDTNLWQAVVQYKF